MRGLVLDMSTVPWLDSTACSALKKTLEMVRNADAKLYFANANSEVQSLIQDICSLDGSHFFECIHDAEVALESSRSATEFILDAEVELESDRDRSASAATSIPDSQVSKCRFSGGPAASLEGP